MSRAKEATTSHTRRAKAFDLFAQGVPSKEVARRLDVTERQVARYRKGWRGKLAEKNNEIIDSAAALLQSAAAPAVQRLLELVQSEDQKVALDAAKTLLDRAGHPAVKAKEITADVETKVEAATVVQLTREEAIAIARGEQG